MLDPKTLWKTVVEEIDLSIESTPIKAWLRQTQGIAVSEEDGELIVGCEYPYTRDFLQKNSQALLEDALLKITKKQLQIRWEILPPSQKGESPLFDKLPEGQARTEQITGATLQERIRKQFDNENLNENYTLEKFVIGPSNRVAHAAAYAVIENPGRAYNPLFIFGPTGVGKTHLLHAVGNSLKEQDSTAKISYFTSEQFLNDFVEYLMKKGKMAEFRKRYRNVDCILVDDIQFLGGKEAIQEEFYHTFNHMYQEKKQIVLASDRSPEKIDNLADRLVSRFKGGLMVDISAPDYETRAAIVQTKAQEHGLHMNAAVIELIATVVESNIREIEGAILKIKSELVAQEIGEVSTAFIQEILGEKKATDKILPQKITPEVIMGLVMDAYNVTMKELCGKRRKQEYVIPRQLAMFMLRDELGMNYVDIGDVLGGRDHTTVMHGCEQVKSKIEEGDAILQSTLTGLRKQLYRE